MMNNNRYLLVKYQLRKDNRGNRRLFRTIVDLPRIHEACGLFVKTVETGKFLRVELLKKQDLQVIAQWGDEAIEDNWVDTQLAR